MPASRNRRWKFYFALKYPFESVVKVPSETGVECNVTSTFEFAAKLDPLTVKVFPLDVVDDVINADGSKPKLAMGAGTVVAVGPRS